MSGSQPGGHELFGLCTSRVAFHVLSYPGSQVGQCQVMEGAPSPWPHTQLALLTASRSKTEHLRVARSFQGRLTAGSMEHGCALYVPSCW